MTNYITTYLKDYSPSNFLIDTVDLTFELSETVTVVVTKLKLQRNNLTKLPKKDALQLVGEKLKLISLQLNEQELPLTAYTVSDKDLTIHCPPDEFILTITTEIHPELNTELTGLYKSKTLFCTQCEAEGFRRITYFLDRPDIMSRYTTKIIADKRRYPILLSNGNLIAQGEYADNKHYVIWQDPYTKPCYLFALVAGDLDLLEDNFITKSNRKIDLKIYVDKGNLDKTQHAMFALKSAMQWDEEVFGREYDLDLYMIVAVNDFNMGAMENKGLNIFNTKYVLANPNIATDDDLKAIIGVIGHEYFHNWTGNRITCRDWFQLSLKEGLTIYRDQEFTADMTSRAVKRIQDVRILRTYQFAEDASPMAHPVRPDSYIEINNFYTHTVYEKGAEVIRMMSTLLGKEGFHRGMDLYFNRHDGQAVTIEDFVKAMEDANEADLSQFRLWYSQSGTPKISVTTHFEPTKKEYSLSITQSCPATPNQKDKKSFQIPVVLSLLDKQGNEVNLAQESKSSTKIKTKILQLKSPNETFIFSNIEEQPVPVLLHNFSAPVILELDYSEDDLLILMKHANDMFCKFEAGQLFFLKVFNELMRLSQQNQTLVLPQKYIEGLLNIISDKNLDPAFISENFSLPNEKYLFSIQENVDIEATHLIRRFILKQIAIQLESVFLKCYLENQDKNNSLDKLSTARRQLKNTVLQYLMMIEDKKYFDLSKQQYQQSQNMTDRLAALQAIVNSTDVQKGNFVEDFYQHWKNETLVIDKWFSLQAMSNQKDTFDNVKNLAKHEAFTITNPNRVRSLVGAFSNNTYHFHRIDGKGYEFLTDYIIELNELNPQIAARLLEPMIRWKNLDTTRQTLIHKQLEKLANLPNLSNNVYEIVEKSLNS